MQVQLAQFNVGTLRASIDHPDTAAFAEGLDIVNALAEATQGYVWRLQSDEGDEAPAEEPTESQPMVIAEMRRRSRISR